LFVFIIRALRLRLAFKNFISQFSSSILLIEILHLLKNKTSVQLVAIYFFFDIMYYLRSYFGNAHDLLVELHG